MRSIIVTNDLIDCPGNGLIIGANGITVDLDGHIIDGVGIETGIANLGFNSATIKNGTSPSSTTGSCSTRAPRRTSSPASAPS